MTTCCGGICFFELFFLKKFFLFWPGSRFGKEFRGRVFRFVLVCPSSSSPLLLLLTSSTGIKMSTQMFPRATASKRFSSSRLLPEEEAAAAAALDVVVCRSSPLRRARGIDCHSVRSPVSFGAWMQLNCCKDVVASLLDACTEVWARELRGGEMAARERGSGRLMRLKLDVDDADEIIGGAAAALSPK